MHGLMNRHIPSQAINTRQSVLQDSEPRLTVRVSLLLAAPVPRPMPGRATHPWRQQ